MREEGFVKSVSGNTCEVIIRRKSACGENCASCKGGCEAREQLCSAENTAGAAVGDRVVLEMDSSKILKSAFLVYILPILVFLAVFAFVSELGGTAVSALCALGAAAAVFVCLGIYDRQHKNDYLPSVTEII